MADNEHSVTCLTLDLARLIRALKENYWRVSWSCLAVSVTELLNVPVSYCLLTPKSEHSVTCLTLCPVVK